MALQVALRQRRVVVMFGVVGLAALILSVAVWPTQPPITAIASPQASPATPGSPSTSGPPLVDDPGEPWGDLDLPPSHVIATLVATKMDRDRVATNTAFTLTSLGSWTAAELAGEVVAEPPVDLTIDAGPGAASATIRPASPLDPGQLYRFSMRTPDGALGGSWVFQTAMSLHVVTTVPGDQAINVPIKTGIEFTFDQDGMVDIGSHVSIQPSVKGTFEQHGRTAVFVPDGLEPATVYNVTLRKGVALEGSDQVLEEDLQIEFETAPKASATPDSPERPEVTFSFDRAMIEVAASEVPTLAVYIYASPPELARRPFSIEIYRLPSETAAIEAVRTLTDAPSWAAWSDDGLVSTDGLSRLSAFTATPAEIRNSGQNTFRLPDTLESGWYLVEIPRPGRGAQTVLQVTNVAAYTAIATDRLIVWAQDIASGTALSGAMVETSGGDALGQTDADGLLTTTTPPEIRSAAGGREASVPQVLLVRSADGRSAIVPIPLRSGGGAYLSDYSGYDSVEPDASDYWRFLATDRGLFRRTDTVNAWGFIRPREGASPLKDPELILTTDSGRSIAALPVTVDRSGAFATSLPFEDLPYGTYMVRLASGDLELGSVWLSVAEIRKPAYAISLATDRHVVVTGDPVTLTARASFFDGTPVPGLGLSVDMFETKRAATTDQAGAAVVTGAVEDSGSISVRPSHSEEAEISASTYLRVFPSRVMIEAAATIKDSRIALAGNINDVEIERIEAAWPSEWWIDPKGEPVGNHPLTVEIIERVRVRIKTNHVYDFINKLVVDTYDYRWDEVSRTTQSLRTGTDGSFHLELAAKRGHTYEMRLSAADDHGRQATTWVTPRDPALYDDDYEGREYGAFVPYLATRECGDPARSGYRIGDRICLEMRQGAGALPTGGGNRYLFFAVHRGLRDVWVQDSPEFNTPFSAGYVPHVDIRAVRFGGTTFTPVEHAAAASFDHESRRLTVKINADRARYLPGQTVTLDIWTTDTADAPVSAAVVLRSVDEKLFAIGGAFDEDPLSNLYFNDYWDYARDSSLLWTHASHPVPVDRGDGCGYWGCGDTAGGGDDVRDTFADALLFKKVTTNSNGHARVSFKLSDDLTSWHVSATATTAMPQAGAGAILIPVGLPFFVDATLAPEYLAGDRPTLRLRSFGTDLQPGDRVTYKISSKSLPLATTARATGFGDVLVALPILSAGSHTVTIEASTGSGDNDLSDRLVRRFEVVASRLTRTQTTYTPLIAELKPGGGAGWTTYVFSDAGRGRYLPLLQSLGWSSGARVDQALAATMARELLLDAFGVDPDSLPPAPFEPARYQRSWEGVALLPYSSPDPALTARIALLAGNRFDRSGLLYALRGTEAPDWTRERRVLAAAGLAGIGEPVLADLHRLNADPSLTIRERLYLALGFAALGDDATAVAMERDLLGQYGERRGATMRLRVGRSLDDTIEATSLLALVAAQVGEPFAPELQAYVDANPAVDELYSLQQISFVTRMLDHTPSRAASFVYSLGGERTVVDLGPGDSYSMRLTESQWSTLSVGPLDGSVGLATTWQAPLDRGAITPDRDVALSRSVLPSGEIPGTGLVEVRLTATFGPQAVAGCYVVTDLVPSGLAPTSRLQGWDGYGYSADDGFVSPFDIEAQRVSFCVGPSKSDRTARMRYFARVVSPGEYVWEPAIIQSTSAAESFNLTAIGRVTVR